MNNTSKLHKIYRQLKLLGLLITISVSYAQAQQVIVNSKGEKIVIFPDGSWRHFESKDSTLLNSTLKKGETLRMNEDFSDEYNGNPTLNDENSRNKAGTFIAQLKAEFTSTRESLISATNDKFNLEAKLNQANENKNFIDADLVEKLENEYSMATEIVKQAKKRHDGIEKIMEKAIDLPSLEFAKREKLYAKLQSKYRTLTGQAKSDMASVENIKKQPKIKKQPSKDLKSNSRKKDKLAATERVEKKSRDRTKAPKVKPPKNNRNVDDVAKTKTPKVKRPKATSSKSKPPRSESSNISKAPARINSAKISNKSYSSKPYECKVAQEVVDDVTGQKRIIMAPVKIFSHTDDELRPYFRDQDLLQCNANLSVVSGYKYLTMSFKISSPNARKNFGMLQNGALMRLKLMDGSFLNFFNIQADRGKIDNYTGDTVFTGYFQLGKSAEKALLDSEVDKLRIVWSTGYEDYDIYELDFFKDQLNCLNNL